MKLIIEIPLKVATAIQNGEDYRYDIHTSIAQGVPYEPQGDLISRDALIKWIDDSISQFGNTYSIDMLNMWGLFKDYLINNAQTVDITEEQAIDKLHETGWLPKHDKEMTERPCSNCQEFDCYGCNYKEEPKE